MPNTALKRLANWRLSPGVLTGMRTQCLVTAFFLSVGWEVSVRQQLGVAFILLAMDYLLWRLRDA